MIERNASSLHFGDLGAVPPEQLVTHMNDPGVAAHLPLLTRRWTVDDAVAFQAAKAQRWLEDGLGIGRSMQAIAMSAGAGSRKRAQSGISGWC